MKRLCYTLRLLCFFSYWLLLSLPAGAQYGTREKKYTSLLWEVRAPGAKRPSYLMGTMHVSSKLAFNLPDSFYQALRRTDLVALETNPESWQEDISRFDMVEELADQPDRQMPPDHYLRLRTLKFYRYDKKIERALAGNPSSLNTLLYRSYGSGSGDFEEDTYLDLYLYQCGRKWGKKVAGLERYGESLQLLANGYRDAAREKNRRQRSFSDYDDAYSTDKLQEAYRRGDLDLLDSINKHNSESAAFDEQFIYRRNEIQAEALDSLLRSGLSVFAGVGAAHLPGDRGVIEILRRKGYTLRPVKMGERASRQKEILEQVRVSVSFRPDSLAHGQIVVETPGKLYPVQEDAALEQWQYADMANGSYYMVSRVMTSAWLWDHDADKVLRKVDSLLYENIPGKIIRKLPIRRDGFSGFDILNRTRRGDEQRYQIFVTPFEILIFKISGNGAYIRQGPEAEKFFGSIRLKAYPAVRNGSSWVPYTPPNGGYTIQLPHAPFVGNDGSWILDAADRESGNFYRLIRSDIQHFGFAGEDAFDLSLMEESFAASAFVDTVIRRRSFTWNGYPTREVLFRHRSGKVLLTRFILQGPHYFTLAALGREENPGIRRFLASFALRPSVYGRWGEEADTTLFFSVKRPLPSMPERKIIPVQRNAEQEGEPLLHGSPWWAANGWMRGRNLSADSSGENLYIQFRHLHRYAHFADSLELYDWIEAPFPPEEGWRLRSEKRSWKPDGFLLSEKELTDTSSSRLLRVRTWYRRGMAWTLAALGDTLSPPGSLVTTGLQQFFPADTLPGLDPMENKNALFFRDFFGEDSLLRLLARYRLTDIHPDSTDLPLLRDAIGALSWKEKDYLGIKTKLVGKLGAIPTPASAALLQKIYREAGDTIWLQYAALENLLQHRTLSAFTQFGDLVRDDPPVLDTDLIPDREPSPEEHRNDNGSFLDEWQDSLLLTRAILPDLLPLMNLREYEPYLLRLLATMADSGWLRTADYDSHYGLLLLRARQELKKQQIAEKKRSIIRTVEKDHPAPWSIYASSEDEGNEELSRYARLLLPFWDKKEEVRGWFRQVMASSDKQLRYSCLLLLADARLPFPDSLPAFFAADDAFRFALFQDLQRIGREKLFDTRYAQPVDLAASLLRQAFFVNPPDSLQFLERRRVEEGSLQGLLCFFRYKLKKEDLNWKIAAAGLLPADSSRFFPEGETGRSFRTDRDWLQERYPLSAVTQVNLKEGKEREKQLSLLVKKLCYSQRRSAERFFEDDDGSAEQPDDF